MAGRTKESNGIDEPRKEIDVPQAGIVNGNHSGVQRCASRFVLCRDSISRGAVGGCVRRVALGESLDGDDRIFYTLHPRIDGCALRRHMRVPLRVMC
jgi:hypothetical protein